MKAWMLAVLCMVAWAQGCTAQANSIHNDATTDTGGAESASGAQDTVEDDTSGPCVPVTSDDIRSAGAGIF